MNREDVEKMIQEYGSGSPVFKGKPLKMERSENGIVYENGYKPTGDDPINVNINGVNLYVQDTSHIRFEVDNWGLVIRLYYGDGTTEIKDSSMYVGAIVKSWEDIETFSFGEYY